jgi:hypothetical protein
VLVHQPRWRRIGRGRGGLPHQLHQQRGNAFQRHAVIHLHCLQRRTGHARVLGIGWGLHHRQAPTLLDGLQPGSAIGQGAGEQHADDTRAVGECGRAEQRVHRRARVVLPGAARELHRFALQEQVVVRRGDQDAPGPQRVARAGVGGGQRPGGLQQRGQRA